MMILKENLYFPCTERKIRRYDHRKKIYSRSRMAVPENLYWCKDSREFLDERNAILSNIEASETDVQNISFHHEKQSLGMLLQSFFQSLFHMNINRLFISDQRIFEMMIYDYLLKYYKSTVFYNTENIL
ncbi:lantibiotic dehydratase C-terminal domain-containing protein [Chryseobacterium indologenes]|nr:lantibiotic dehydratase C-terminal domain-containing protein [Chryseobacterium indologenes]